MQNKKLIASQFQKGTWSKNNITKYERVWINPTEKVIKYQLKPFLAMLFFFDIIGK